MNIFFVDTKECDLNKAKEIHEYLSANLNEVITFPMSETIDMLLKVFMDYQNEKRLRDGAHS